MSFPNNKTLILVGMHRSGTSLTAQWLEKTGLFIGDKMVGSNVGNENGHFEDEDFNFLQHNILQENSLSYKVRGSQKIKIAKKFEAQAKAIVLKRNEEKGDWGWKDPRTCLLLDFWNNLIPNPYYLFVYRSYSEVASSIYRREIKKFKKRKNKIGGIFQRLSHYKNYNSLVSENLESWIKHNESILNFIKDKKPQNYIVVNSENVIASNEKLFYHLKDNWGFDLSYFPISNLYDQKKMDKKSGVEVSQSLKDKANSVFNQLEKLEESSSLKNLKI